MSKHVSRTYHRILLGLLLVGGPVLAPSAHAASSAVLKGAGFGHGVGMSQYGALGQAQEGRGYREILGHYYSGTRIARLDAASEVRVLLQSGARTVRFAGATRVAGGRALRPATTYRVTRGAAGQVVLRSPGGRSLGTFRAPLRVEAGASGIRLLGRAGNGITSGRYRGALELRPGTFIGVNAINAVELEDYVRGVVSGESPASWPAEALRAQAVAARTYAITTSKNGPGFDQYPDVRSQVYNGIAAERPSTDAAVAATRREVVTHGGKPVVTYFFSTSGGRTENVENSFLGAKPAPHLRSVEDPWDRVSPRHRWQLRWTVSQLDRRLGSWVEGSLVGVRVLQRGSSPRVVKAEVVGTRGRTSVTGPQLRSRLGLHDTWVSFTIITGRSEEPAPEDEASEPAEGGAPPETRAARSPARSVLRGRVHPGGADRWVTVQRRQGRRWVREVEVLTRRGGRYRAPVHRAGTYRVVARGTAGPSLRVP